MTIKVFIKIFYSFVVVFLLNACGLPTDDLLWVHEQTIKVDKGRAEQCIPLAVKKINTFKVIESRATLYGLQLKIEGFEDHPELDLKVWAFDENHVQILFTGSGTKEPEDIKIIIHSRLKEIAAEVIRACIDTENR